MDEVKESYSCGMKIGQPWLWLSLHVLFGSYRVVIFKKNLISWQHLQIVRFHIKVWISVF